MNKNEEPTFIYWVNNYATTQFLKQIYGSAFVYKLIIVDDIKQDIPTHHKVIIRKAHKVKQFVAENLSNLTENIQ